MIIEDDAIIAMLLTETLVAMGHQVCAVETTEMGAVAAAAQHCPDLLIVDAVLREGNGVSAVGRILDSGFVPHIFVSGADLRPAMLNPRAVKLGKPYDERALVAAIERAFETPVALY
jgi:DNA-binding response OmpR family regulator